MLKRLLSHVVAARRDRQHDQHLAAARAACESGRGDVAEIHLKRAIELKCSSASAHALLADLLSRSGHPARALELYRRALSIDPHDAAVRMRAALLLEANGRFDEASGEYARVAHQSSDWPQPYVAQGRIALARGEWKNALRLLECAVAIDPDDVESRIQFAIALRRIARLDTAIEHCDAALRIDPAHVGARSQLAELLAARKRGQTGAERSARATATSSDGAQIAMAIALPQILRSREEIASVRAQLASDIARLREAHLVLKDPPPEVGITAFYLAYHGQNDRTLQVALAELYLEACPGLAYTAAHCGSAVSGTRRLRVGIVSAYLYEHSIGRVVEGLVAKLDRGRFEVHAFGFVEAFDTISHAIAGSADRWTVLPRSLGAAREIVASARLDVLLYPDVGMDPLTYFMAFSRLATVQCTTWGHPVTSGVPALDYFLSTDYFEPADGDGHYSERLVRLNDVALPGYYKRPGRPEAGAPAEPGFESGRHIYFCPQALFKFHPDFDAIAADILRRDPAGELVLVYDPLPDVYRRPALFARMQRAAPDVAERIRFLPRAPDRDGYLRRLMASDVVLDTVHYCGGNTSLEAISVNAPVVTLPSQMNRGRHTCGFFSKMRFMDTVASSPDEYASLAVRIATDREFRTHVKRVQEEHASALYEDQSAIDQISRFFETAVKQ